MNTAPVLALKGATVEKSGRLILGPLDYDLFGSGVTSVIGPNGAGKTTLLRCLFGLDPLTSGNRVAQSDTLTMSFVFQSPVLLRRSVMSNAVYPLDVAGWPSAKAERLARARLGEVGLGDVLNRPAQTLSSGEKQKLALVRAMITDPDILFLDEPTANLDGRSNKEIEAALGRAADAGTKVILASHDLGQVRRLADDVVFLAGGALVEGRKAKEFFSGPNDPKAEAFLNGDIVE